jgi:alpha-tubulin suppressor-like RCC1 family protein
MSHRIAARGRKAVTLAAGLTVLAMGCGQDAEPPSGPAMGSTPGNAAASLAAPTFRSVSAAWDHTCGITTGARAYCWGNNQSGQLGDFSRIKRLTPVPTQGNRSFDTLSAGIAHTCAVTTDHEGFCWGESIPGQVTNKPTAIDPSLHFVQVSAGYTHFCGITSSGQAYCRGNNSSGQLGDGTRTDRPTPVPVAGGHVFRFISVNDFHTCAVTVGDVAYCWGDDTFGQTGDGATGNGSDEIVRLQPTAVAGGLRFATIGAGTIFTCGLTTANRAYCWGSNVYGQIGDESLTDRPLPTAVHGGRRFRQLGVGNSHVCAVTTDNRAFCWGRGAEGQLGIGEFDTLDEGQKPHAVVGGLSFRQVTAGGLHSCGVTTGNVVYCWGNNQKGQLGDGTTISRSRPRKVVGTS